MNKRGMAGFVVGVIGVVIGIILLVAVAVPITKNIVDSANLSGTDSTIAGIFVTLLLVAGLVLIAGLALMGFASRK